MSRLRSALISAVNMHVLFNMCLITQAYFKCGVISLLPKQEDLLMKTSEAALLRKLGLSKRFPRAILHAQKLQLGAGIMKPLTIIALLSLKLYLGHRRNKDQTAKQIKIYKRNASFQCRCNENIIEIYREVKSKEIV